MVQCNHKSPLKWKVKESEVIQLCLTLCDSMDCSLPRSSIHGILQERILEWFAIAFSRGSFQPRDRTWVSLIAGRHFTLMASKMAESQGLQADSRARKGKKMDFPLKFNLYFGHSSVQLSRSVVSDSLRPHELQHARPPCPSPTHRVHPDSHPLSQWCHPAILSSVVPFSSCPQSLPASESFPRSQLFAWGGQRTGVSALASFLPKKSQGWSPSEWTGWISL